MSDRPNPTPAATSRPEPSFADFVSRHVGPDAADLEVMLEVIGQPSLDAMCDVAIPAAIRSSGDLRVEAAPSEVAVLEELRGFASRNTVLTSMIGLGYYGTVTPPVVRRRVLENPGWYTAYTPYQPEISQGRLEALLNFQTVISDLTGLAIAGSSLLDESTAAAEAMSLMHRAGRKGPDAVVLVDQEVFPQTIGVMQTRARAIGLPLVVTSLRDITSADALTAATDGAPLAGVIVQYPGSSGTITDWAPLAAATHEAGGLVTACADLLALTLITPAGYMSVHRGLERQLPGRLVGVSVDADGRRAYRLALQTREQHIRREKATSNICTAQVLLAVMASMYAVWHGPAGLTEIARRIRTQTAGLREALIETGHPVEGDTFFDTLTVSVPERADDLVRGFVARGINVRRVDGDRIAVSLDETTTTADLSSLLEGFGAAESVIHAHVGSSRQSAPDLPAALARTSDFLTHPVFHAHHSETAMLRYIRKLSDRDYALDRGMIPLGSCTMKLNATTEMEAISWPEFANLHPFAPTDQTSGIRALIDDLSSWLCEITGYDAVSLQPNAGSQGEFAGLLAIHAYHEARGEGHRRVCLIPASAHGTNAASAVMAGLKVVVVKTAPGGSIDLDDLRAKVEQHRDNLAAIMVTYPSTHGVYEDTITELCELVHDAGGQVYVDGANLNALMGLAQPGKFGADVSHLNLHKTFCIPHGGGGPGVGPVAVRAHLAPHLPNHPLAPECGPESGVGPISGAPYGSASILPISWAYIRLVGGAGLKHSTQMAVLAANYVATRLRQHYPVLYSGHDDLVAHECILDLRQITADTGVTVDDVAKRLVDYGFHAPTMSFPVAGTLMVEPTESENRYELDRFCDAMIAIRDEIEAIHKGDVAVTDSMLRHAPHTASAIAAGEWSHPYERTEAAFPAGVDAADKYWPPVSRIDGAFGDRNLVCSCPAPEEFED